MHDRLITVGHLDVLPDDGLKYELQTGVLLSEPLPGFRHGRVVARMSELLNSHVRARQLGAVLADAGFILARRPDTVRGPDIPFVTAERLQNLEDPAAAFSGAPDLAIEIVSPSNTSALLHARVADYLAAGTRIVWVADSQRQTVTVYRSLLSPRVLGRDDDLDGEDVVHGFRARVFELFAD